MTSVYVQNEGKCQVTIYTDVSTYASSRYVSKLIIKKFTPQCGWNTAKVGVKHQSSNQSLYLAVDT